MIKSNFNSLTSTRFVAQVEQIITAMTGNADFPEPWPATVPTLAQIQADFAAFQTELTATSAGDKTRIVARNAARSRLANDLNQLAYHVQTVAQDDATKLVASGFPLRQPRGGNHTPLPLPAPDRFQLVRGPVSGTVIVSSGRVEGAGSYDVQTTTGDPTVEANWIGAGSYKTCRRIQLEGLVPGKVYSVRIRALGSAGPGAWTPASSLMVV